MIIYCGDTHSLKIFYSLIKQLPSNNCNILHVGDVGIGFKGDEKEDKYWLNLINNLLIKFESKAYFIRGNHDNPYYFQEDRYNFSNIKFVKDYELLQIEDKKILFVGGAISIDRNLRKENQSWWADEIFVLNKELIPSESPHIVITHTKPWYIHMTGKLMDISYFLNGDSKLANDLLQEGQLLAELHDSLNLTNTKKWIFGHFHEYHFEEFDGIKYYCVPINSFLAEI